ncbi:MAG: 23S rRNA (adenine(2503)-C(2))-methyltransferase RlmN [Ignavibacteriales bacterium]|nr:23S rRNA (adenine(2503)-C(2))-methyltransferase RlmN [Ignavibacteriales bacterium]
MKIVDLKGLTLKELEDFALSISEKKFRGKQLFDWLYNKEVASFTEMSSLAKSLRDKLAGIYRIESIQMVDVQESADGTKKFLFELLDGKRIESVLIPPRTAFVNPQAREDEEQKRLTLCLSTQVGCPLDCKFCATGTMGFLRNLTTGEIIDQVLLVKRYINKRITNLVYMGMGEPLLNYDNVMKSIEIITTGMGIAARRITVSTVGLVPQIRRIANEKRKMKLAISLHSLDDKIRSALMPIAKKYKLVGLLDAVDYYFRKTKLRPTFEYILFDGVNDRDDDIQSLIKLSKRIPCKVNIIPFHNIHFTDSIERAGELHPTPSIKMEEFAQRLREAHITLFIRSSAGEDIDAACGQLAVKTNKKHRISINPSASGGIQHSTSEVV